MVIAVIVMGVFVFAKSYRSLELFGDAGFLTVIVMVIVVMVSIPSLQHTDEWLQLHLSRVVKQIWIAASRNVQQMSEVYIQKARLRLAF